jgi:hypothetical protein
MVEPLRTVLDRDEDFASYKPVALLAVAAFGVSLLFSGLVIILTIVGLITKRPVLEPWLIPLAFFGVLLSIAGRWQIQLSEGTREGRRLTNIAWWLSIVGGCVYLAYYFGNVMAIQSQARVFVRDVWLDELQTGEMDKAYVYTIAPDQRRGMNITDVTRRFGDVVAPFREEKLSRLLDLAKKNAEITPIGSPEWNETTEGLLVNTKFRIVTAEGEFLAHIPIVGTLSKESGTREWYVKRQSIMLKSTSLSDFGIILRLLEGEIDAFMTVWLREKMAPSRRAEQYLDTQRLSQEERKSIYTNFLVRTFLAPSLADLTAFPAGPRPPVCLMGATRFQNELVQTAMPEITKTAAGIIVWDESKQKREASEKEQMTPLLLNMQNVQMAMRVSSEPEGRVGLEILPTEIRATMPVDVNLPILKYRCRGKLIAVCQERALVSKLNSLKGELSRGGSMTAAHDMLATMPRAWRIAELNIDLARDMGDLRPGGANATQMGIGQ